MSSIGSLFNISTQSLRNSTSLTPAAPSASATASSDKPATPGSSVGDWVSFFESLPKGSGETMRNAYLSHLTLPTPAISLDTDDD